VVLLYQKEWKADGAVDSHRNNTKPPY